MGVVTGGYQPFLTVTTTLTHADILALPTVQAPLVDPTEILDYAAEPQSLPYPIMCNGWLLNPNGVGYNNLVAPTYLDLCWGADYSATVGRAVEWQLSADPPQPLSLYGGGVFDGRNWPITFVMAPDPFAGNGYQDNGIYVSLNANHGSGDLTDGDPNATLTLRTIYYVSERPV